MLSRNSTGRILILSAAVLWGTTGTSQALAPTGASSLTIGAARLFVGGLALLALAFANGDLSLRRHAEQHLSWPILPVIAAGMCMAVYQVFFFNAVRLTGVASGTLIAIGSAPLIAGLLAFLQRRQAFRWPWLFATLLAITGCTLLMLPGQTMQIQPLGVLLAIGAGASYALYTIATEGLVARHPPGAVAAITFCLGALLLSPLLILGDLGWLVSPGGLLVALHLGMFATALAYALFTRGLRTTPAPTAVSLSLAEPLTASLLGVFLLGEKLLPMALTGMGLIFAGLLILALARS